MEGKVNMKLLADRKIFLYGDEKYINDFIYLFGDLKIDGYIKETSVDENCNCYDDLNRIIQVCRPFIIICKFDENEVRRNLKNIGYTLNEDFASATAFFEKLDFPIKDISKRREIYVWGTGERGNAFFNDFVIKHPDIEIYGCIDSDNDKFGKVFHNRIIYDPKDIINREDIFIIVATTKHYWEIKEFLTNNKKKENVDFVHMYEINQYASRLARETIYDSVKTDFLCKRPFLFSEIWIEGRMTCCCGIPNLRAMNTPIYYSEFSNVWHSNIMKVIRLSIVNGTYTFCNPLQCEYIYECKDFNENNDICNGRNIKNSDNYTIIEKEFPKVLQCGFDVSCNLHCPSCRNDIYIADCKERKTLNYFAEYLRKQIYPNVKKTIYAGGEPTISAVYDKIIFDKGTNIKEISVLSNGLCLTPTYVNKLEEQYDNIEIGVSMDGATKEIAEKLRRGINFEQWKSNMLYISKLRKENRINLLGFTFVVQKDNYREMPDFVKMCLEFNADYIRFSRVLNRGQWTNEEYEAIAMCDSSGNMLPELKEVVSDEIFQRPEVKLFGWIEWFV